MSYGNSNNSFFSYQGYINRKDYTVNLFILFALYIVLSAVRFESFTQYTNAAFLLNIILFLAGFLKFIILMSVISVVYRRIEDISENKSYKFYIIMKRLFVILFVIPILYFFCIRYFFGFIPLDYFVLFILTPLSLISSVILCFIKGQR